LISISTAVSEGWSCSFIRVSLVITFATFTSRPLDCQCIWGHQRVIQAILTRFYRLLKKNNKATSKILDITTVLVIMPA
jgi:hypothetical protein